MQRPFEKIQLLLHLNDAVQYLFRDHQLVPEVSQTTAAQWEVIRHAHQRPLFVGYPLRRSQLLKTDSAKYFIGSIAGMEVDRITPAVFSSAFIIAYFVRSAAARYKALNKKFDENWPENKMELHNHLLPFYKSYQLFRQQRVPGLKKMNHIIDHIAEGDPNLKFPMYPAAGPKLVKMLRGGDCRKEMAVLLRRRLPRTAGLL